MALARTHAVALVGVEGHVVEVETDIGNGLPAMILVGLPDTALREARDRIRAAICNSGEPWPGTRMTVGLSPASLPKRGSGFDLAIAVGVLAAGGAVPTGRLATMMFLAELGLDGRLHPVNGVLPAVLAAAEAGLGTVVVSAENAAEAALVPGVRVVAAGCLAHVCAWLRGGPRPQLPSADPAGPAGARESRPALGQENGPAGARGNRPALGQENGLAGGRGNGSALGQGNGAQGGPGSRGVGRRDMADVIGQAEARAAAEISAAGGHNLLLAGPPGAGKTMLAERLPTILPPLDRAAALAVTSIHSVAGTLPSGAGLVTRPPFCAPHHTASKAAIVGGGSGIIRPGAASLAHCGILFLDEAPEFDRDVLDALRQPLESGSVTIARAGMCTTFPAQFALALAANPCPCARYATSATTCDCSPAARRRYQAKLSGPLLDRVDVKVELRPVGRAELLHDRDGAEPSRVVAARVLAARQRAAHRLAGTPWRLNAQIPGAELRRAYPPAAGALDLREVAMARGQVSARGADKIIRVAWSVADLAGRERPAARDVDTAIGLWTGVRR